jgi:prepilin-type N-terminal cleavage/methylation domain-containing protein
MIGILRNKYGNRPFSGGFTMLEMMIIVVIIGIVAAIAVPSFFAGVPRLKARTEARNVLNMTRLARSKAISEGAQYGVFVDTYNNQYLLFKDISNPETMTYEVTDSIVVGPQSIPADLLPYSTFNGDVVVFLSTGRASQSGDFTFMIYDGGAQYTVSVLASTGRSKLQ